jgi:hypothetical protein|tara:strand:- start:18 stop:167 length:150 start_codon:yes stop_codon:yes gene_type:complete
MTETDGGGSANALTHTDASGTDDGTPPGWWMTTMGAYLTKIKQKSALRL